MAARVPKQLLQIGGKTVLEHSLQALAGLRELREMILVSNACDEINAIAGNFDLAPLRRVDGGRERCHSVLNGLGVLAGQADANDWVLVHDAARPCLRLQDVQNLIKTLNGHPHGGLLGIPVRDTMKRTGAANAIVSTERRVGLWHAHTPQMFRYGLLKSALEKSLADGYEVTDESSAMEHAGYHPLMVEGHADNLKITRPEDLPLAEYYLEQQGRL